MSGKGALFSLGVMLFGMMTHAELWADLVDLPPIQDTTLFEDDSGQLGNGAGKYLFIGKTWDENGIESLLRRAVLEFDLTAIPAGSTVDSANFTFTIDRVPPAATAAIINLHLMTADWGEGASNAPGAEGRGALAKLDDATWLHTFWDTQLWSTPGGDFELLPVASEPISSSPEVVIFETSAQMVATVQGWVDEPDSNHGWILLGDEVFPQNARRVLSRENTAPGSPVLSVEFTLPPPPPAVSVPAMSVAGLLVLGFVLFVLGWISLPETSRVYHRRDHPE